MPTSIRISLSSQPAPFSQLVFNVVRTGSAYSKTFVAVFVSGVSVNESQVTIGSTLADTMNNLAQKFQTQSIGQANVSYVAPDVIVALTIDGDYALTVYQNAGGLATVGIEDSDVSIVTVPTRPDFELLSIEIVDTYENDRPLIIEKAIIDSLKLEWDGGDDIYTQFRTSKLTFTMIVTDMSDAKFKHLFTGDERRYLVKLSTADVGVDPVLIWQGFLLPDQFREPYKNGVIPVEFTAVDNIGTLKGKYFKPWYYEQRFPIAELIAMCLAETGLDQDIHITPAVEPAAGASWWHVNVPLMQYKDGKKFKSIYDILQDVMQAQGLTVYTYLGAWKVEGINRQQALSGQLLVFSAQGVFQGVADYEKVVQEVGVESGSPYFDGLTPWRAVNVNFSPKGTKNLFSDNVATVTDAFSTVYLYSAHAERFPGKQVYLTKFHRPWIKNVGAAYDGILSSPPFWKQLFAWGAGVFTESNAVANYYECPEYPYVKSGVKYELVYEASVAVTDLMTPDLQDMMRDGSLDLLCPFSFFVGGVEIVSNRPSFGQDEFRYIVQEDSSDEPLVYLAAGGSVSNSNISVTRLSFRFKHEFTLDTGGVAVFRALLPIFDLTPTDYFWGDFSPTSLKLNVVQDAAASDVIAKREVNFTQELDWPMPFTCTVDTSLENGMGIGVPVSDNYFQTLDRSIAPNSLSGVHYFKPNTILDLSLFTWKIDSDVWSFLFRENMLSKVYLERASGAEEVFKSVYGLTNLSSIYRMGYLTAYEGNPSLPSDYRSFSDVAVGDNVMFMNVAYGEEDLNDRLVWKLNGSITTDTLLRCIAKLLHSVRYQACYRFDATAYKIVFPGELIKYTFDGEDRLFVPTRLTVDLCASKTSFKAPEAIYQDVNDITYE